MQITNYKLLQITKYTNIQIGNYKYTTTKGCFNTLRLSQLVATSQMLRHMMG